MEIVIALLRLFRNLNILAGTHFAQIAIMTKYQLSPEVGYSKVTGVGDGRDSNTYYGRLNVESDLGNIGRLVIRPIENLVRR